jgi:hypothetical protein
MALDEPVGRMPAGRSAMTATTEMAEPLSRSALRGLDEPVGAGLKPAPTDQSRRGR